MEALEARAQAIAELCGSEGGSRSVRPGAAARVHRELVERARAWALEGSVAGSTARKYRAAMDAFLLWRDGVGAGGGGGSRGLDHDLVAWAFHLRGREGGATRGDRQRVLDARSGFSLFGLLPRGGAALPLSGRAMATWDREQPGESRPPLPWAAMLVVARQLVLAGHRQIGAAVVLAFATLLRASDLEVLRACDVALRGDRRLVRRDGGAAAGLHLRVTKTGPHQFVELPSWAEYALEVLHGAAPRPEARLAGDGRRVIAARLAEALGDVGLGGHGYTWHSLRHGGAVFRFLSGEHAEDILIAGRWRRLQTLQIYLATGRARLLAAELPAAVAAAADRLAAEAERRGVAVVEVVLDDRF